MMGLPSESPPLAGRYGASDGEVDYSRGANGEEEQGEPREKELGRTGWQSPGGTGTLKENELKTGDPLGSSPLERQG